MTAKRIQRSRKKGWRMPEGAVYVGRPTKWGNPFNWRDCDPDLPDLEKRRLAVLDHLHWLTKDNWAVYYPEQRRYIMEHIHELSDKDLVCWCPLTHQCHADTLLYLANKRR